MAVLRAPLPHVAYTMVRNCWLRDGRISYKAKGLLGYLASHAEDYKISQAQMVRESDDGRDAVRTGLDELERAGYLRRIPQRSGGRFGEDDYVLADPFDAAGRLVAPDARETRVPEAGGQRETRQSGKTDAGKPTREIRHIEEQGEKTTERRPTNPLVELPLDGVRPDPFDEFWAAYPKKVGKDAARRAWGKAVRRADPARIVAVARVYPFRPDRQFVKDPATWLNAGCWDDDLDAVRQVVAGSNTAARPTPYRDPPPGDYEQSWFAAATPTPTRGD